MKKSHNRNFSIISLWLFAITLTGCVGIDKTASGMTCPTSVANIRSQYTTSSPEISSKTISGWVVYTLPIQDNLHLFLKDLETGNIEQLTNSGDNSGPKWSPDGKRIIFLSHTKEMQDDIYIMEKDGKNKRPLVASKADEDFVNWSPDGSKIAYSSDESGRPQIYVMDLQNRRVNKLTDNITYANQPAWSSDGTRIAFQSADGGEAGRTQIFVMNADGSNQLQMTDYNIFKWDGEPIWCPDDSCLVFSRDAGGGAKLMVLDIANKTVTPLFEDTFDMKTMQTSLSRSPSRCYLTFVIDLEFFAFDMSNKELYPLGFTDALSLSLFP
jgi:Tol biopolymer transport system component